MDPWFIRLSSFGDVHKRAEHDFYHTQPFFHCVRNNIGSDHVDSSKEGPSPSSQAKDHRVL
jgi:hypothetical protein